VTAAAGKKINLYDKPIGYRYKSKLSFDLPFLWQQRPICLLKK
jgi:hypothetical protein